MPDPVSPELSIGSGLEVWGHPWVRSQTHKCREVGEPSEGLRWDMGHDASSVLEMPQPASNHPGLTIHSQRGCWDVIQPNSGPKRAGTGSAQARKGKGVGPGG